MPIYRFTLTRDITESVIVKIEADDIDEAHQQALLAPPTTGWTRDDASPVYYLSDEEDFEEIEA